jgi:hypothetical protein
MHRFVMSVACLGLFQTARAEDTFRNYPERGELKVGEAYGKVSPRFWQPFEITSAGAVKVHFEGLHSTMKEGEVWAELDPGRVSLEENKLENARKAFELKKRNPEADFKRIESERRLNEVSNAIISVSGRDVSLIKRMALGEEATRDYNRQMALALEALEREKKLLERKIVDFDEERATELRSAELNLLSHDNEFERVRAVSLLKMPADGTVTILYPENKEGVYRVQPNTRFAVIEDNSVFRAFLPLTNAGEWKEFPSQSLVVRTAAGAGDPITAGNGMRTSEKINGREEAVLGFTFAEKDSNWARRLSGSNVRFEIFYKPEKPFHAVPKMDLARRHPKLFESGADWASVVKALWPEARLIAVGSRELAVCGKESADTSAAVEAETEQSARKRSGFLSKSTP